jgi:hypothetical protein
LMNLSADKFTTFTSPVTLRKYGWQTGHFTSSITFVKISGKN